MTRRYQLIVIGTGTAASGVAMRAHGAGRSVAVIDHRPFGGTCALRGCDPKKVLVGAAAAVDRAQRLRGKGVAGETRLDWAELIAFKRRFTDPVPEEREKRYEDSGVDTYHGTACFTGRNSVEVAGRELEGERIVIAAGAEPVELGIDGEDHLVKSDDFLAMESLPRRIVFVGAGYIGFEFAHVAVRAGAEVTMLQRSSRVLAPFDEDLVAWLVDKSRALGIEVCTSTPVEAIQRQDNGFSVRTGGRHAARTFSADLVVHAAGRAPALEPLNLKAAGVACENGRLKLNEFLQSESNPAVYAAGDAAQRGPPLTPAASHDAEVVAANLLEGNHRTPDYTGLPSVLFTIPPLASVGMSEAEARGHGRRIRVQSEKTSGWFTARQEAESAYGYKVLVDADSDALLGAHLLGPHVDEVINVFALAMRHGLTAQQLKRTLFAYPTGASDIASML